MKFFILLALVALALGSSIEKGKGRRASIFNLPANTKLRSEDIEQLLRIQADYDDIDTEPVGGELRQASPAEVAQVAALPADAVKGDSSSGRMFLKKLFLLGGLGSSGSSNTQPIIPIIITGTGGTSTGNTGTVTTTGTISGTGTITTTPTGRADEVEGEEYVIGEEDIVEDQILKAKNNANKQQNNVVRLKPGKGGNNQQNLGFVVPQKYLRYFQNNPNTVVLNPAVYNTGSNKIRKFRLNNGNVNGNVKRKRARSPTRRLVAVN